MKWLPSDGGLVFGCQSASEELLTLRTALSGSSRLWAEGSNPPAFSAVHYLITGPKAHFLIRNSALHPTVHSAAQNLGGWWERTPLSLGYIVDFILFFKERVLLCNSDWPGILCVEQAGLEFTKIHLTLPLEWGNQRRAPPHLA